MGRRVIGILSLSAALLFSAYAGLYLLAQSPVFQRWLIARVSENTGYTIQMDDLRFAVPLRFVGSAVKVSAPHGPVLQAEQIVVTLNPSDLFARTVHRLQLRQPIIYLDLEQLSNLTNNKSPAVAVRRLIVEQGTIVLQTGAGRTVDFHSVSLSADDVNLGQTTGIHFRAELPWLASRVNIGIHARAEETQVDLRLEQRGGSAVLALPGSERKIPGVSAATVTLRKNGKEGLAVGATGALNQFSFGRDYLSGRFEVKSEIDAGFQNAAFVGTFTVHDTSLKIGPSRPITPRQTATADIAGGYSVVDKTVHIEALHLQSGWGTAEATAAVSFVPALSLASGRATLRNVPAEVLQQFLPDKLRSLRVNGNIESELQFGGAWPNVQIKGVALMDEAQLKHADWSLAQVSIKAPFEWTNGALAAGDVQVRGRSLSVTRPDRMTFEAEEVSASATLRKSADNPLSAAGNVQLLRGRFASPDGSKVGENIALTGRFETVLPGEKEVTSVAAKLEVQQGELLWGTFFGDLSTQRPTLDFNLDYQSPADSVTLHRFNVSLAGIGSLHLSGAIRRVSNAPAVALTINSDDLQPGRVFDFFIRDTLKLSYPMLERLNIAGTANFSTRLEGGPGQWTVQGDVRVRAGDISEKSGKWQIGPFELALPFKFHFPAAVTTFSGAAPMGNLAITSARFGSELVLPFRTTLSAWNNALEFHQTIPLSIYGGSIEIGNLRWKDLLNDPQDLAFSLSAKGLQLQRLTEHLGWHRFGGILNASIPTVESTGAALRTQGEIQVDVFGGTVRLALVEIQNPFSALFSVRLNTRFEEIRLESASETFEFGRISGILEGTVKDLVITNGQPAQFAAEIHTVQKSGVGQWISVEALNKITVLSSGNDAGALYGGLAGFFDNFRYSRLGFKATLKNDSLTLRGIESRDGKEYLVVGTLLPPTVNIISHTHQIGFGELVKRLERITASGKAEIK